ncbi:MAG TPA: hypothetical protein ENN29_10045 [Candidatus Hydrogenedentes bacterium]|nr:hypothetical protein [Candidatus Hydrogenedentota bacterium]
MKLYKWWMEYWNRQVRKFSITDLKIAEGAAMAFTLIIVHLFPQILAVSVWWFVAALVVCQIRLWYVVLLK